MRTKSTIPRKIKMKGIPEKGSVPPNIRKRSPLNIKFGINIGDLGTIHPKQSGNDFINKIKTRAKPSSKKPGEKISLDDLKNWAVKELAFLLELVKEGASAETIENKKAWLLSLLPESLIDEIMKEAQKLSKRPK